MCLMAIYRYIIAHVFLDFQWNRHLTKSTERSNDTTCFYFEGILNLMIVIGDVSLIPL